jgi:hypothetical protein
MLQDPGNPFEEWEQEVWARDIDTAQVRCKRIAEYTGLTTVLNVSLARKSPSKSGNYRYICWFRTEVLNNDDSNN